jgi:magnesium transporter
MQKQPPRPSLLKLRRRRRSAPGTPPGTLVSHPDASPTTIQMVAYSPDDLTEHAIANVEQISGFLGGWPVLWIRVAGLGNIDIIHQLGELFSLHPLVLEDIINVHQRSKVEEYDRSLFIVTQCPSISNHHLVMEQTSLVLAGGVVLSFQEQPSSLFDPIVQRIRQRKGGRIRLSQADYLSYALIDTMVDSYFPILDQFSEALDHFEEKVIGQPDQVMINQIHGLKRDLLHLRRIAWPLRDAVNSLTREKAVISDSTRVYLRDCYDHVVHIIEILESHRERGSDLINIYLSSISNKMNEVMKVLTIIATVFMPIGVVAGIYGMNFDVTASPYNLPELGWRFGYPFALGLMGAIAVGFMIFFKRRGWLGGGKGRKEKL